LPDEDLCVLEETGEVEDGHDELPEQDKMTGLLIRKQFARNRVVTLIRGREYSAEDHGDCRSNDDLQTNSQPEFDQHETRLADCNFSESFG
jgi:hypothetical protein